MKRLALRACTLLLLVALSSCFLKRRNAVRVDSPESWHPPRNPDDVHRIAKLIPYTLRVRRPTGEGANPKAGPGGTDYRSSPPPSASFDCGTFAELFKDVDVSAVRSCLTTIQAPIDGAYRLRRLPQPYLELQESADTPDCLKRALPRIPVPREILYQSNVEGPVWCYSSRIDIEADEVLGSKVPTHRSVVRVELPARKEDLKSDEATRLLLASWALTPYWEKDDKRLFASLVPDALCSACIGEKNMVTDQDAPPVLWP